MLGVEIASRPAVRIVCLDAVGRVLLLRWQDPTDGAGSGSRRAAGSRRAKRPTRQPDGNWPRRPASTRDAIVDLPVIVDRDIVWNGRRFIGQEPFYLAGFAGDRPALSQLGLRLDEQENLRGYRWVARGELTQLADRLEPPSLAKVIATLEPVWSR